MQHFDKDSIDLFPSRYRASLINSLSGFKSANLVGTVNGEGHTNLAMFSSVVHIGASPALVGLVMRPNSVSRHTLENIRETEQYTINQVSESFWREAHQTSARYEGYESEFDCTNLTPSYIEHHDAPFVEQSRLKYALLLREIVPITLNDTLFVIGEITDILCDTDAVMEDGYIDIEKLATVSVSGLDSYHTTARLSRIQYAKPNETAQLMSLSGELYPLYDGQ
jgi:flavin reductase (DIM6/NTAB) family NADH-FMN oxidoreductase RutF|tara:strand:+ start:248 stop:919 length:672 start_codon:yes stop_codon:yes gene_type:complete